MPIFNYLELIFCKIISIIEVLMMFEGLFFPWKTIDNTFDIIEYSKQFGFKYFHKNTSPTYYIDPGLLILSKTKIEETYEIKLQNDIIHCPGIIGIKTIINQKPIKIFTIHLCPTLPNTTFSYICANKLNALYGISTFKCRQNSILKIKELVHEEPDVPCIIGGDFNINIYLN